MYSHARRWAPVLLWIAAIYTTIPLAAGLRDWFIERWNPIVVGFGVAAILLVASIATLAYLARRPDRPSTATVMGVVGVTVIFLLWTFSLRRSPEEAVHFLEYGVLAILIHRSLRPTIPGALVFVAGALIGALVGTVDEVIQWTLPNRYWDWRDLVLNGGAGALTQFILWRIAPPAAHHRTRHSLRIVLRLAAAQLVLLALCLSNTPSRVARYATYLPNSDHLTSSLNPMAEYGFHHTVPGLGVFSSRLTTEELRRQDTTRGNEVASLLEDLRKSYSLFLRIWPVSEDPFTYEARVHLFARDRNLAKARAQDFNGAAAEEQLSVAWFENRLVEEFFDTTLVQSSYLWSPRLRQRVESAHDPGHHFHSATGSHLITIASERTLRWILLVLVAVMIIVDLRIGGSDGRQP